MLSFVSCQFVLFVFLKYLKEGKVFFFHDQNHVTLA